MGNKAENQEAHAVCVYLEGIWKKLCLKCLYKKQLKCITSYQISKLLYFQNKYGPKLFLLKVNLFLGNVPSQCSKYVFYNYWIGDAHL